MAQHLAATLLPPHQRHWVGPEILIHNDRVAIVLTTSLVSEATKINHFWHVLAHSPNYDGVLFA